MATKIAAQNRQKAFRFSILQLLAGIVVSGFIGLIWEVHVALSFLVGVLLDVLPSFVFAIYAFRFSGAQQLDMITASIYRGEALKILLTALLFIVVFKTLPVLLPPLFIGFLTAKLSQFLKMYFF